jgi:hypothetical protein
MLCIIFLNAKIDEHFHAERHYAQSYYEGCHYPECRVEKCHCAQCCGASVTQPTLTSHPYWNRGLHYKTLQINILQEMDIFRGKLGSSGLNKHTSLGEQSH